MIARWTHSRAAVSVGQCPRDLTTLRIRALTLSMALVVSITWRTAGAKLNNGTRSAHADSRSLTITGYLFSRTPATSARRSRAAASVAAVLRPVLPGSWYSQGRPGRRR